MPTSSHPKYSIQCIQPTNQVFNISLLETISSVNFMEDSANNCNCSENPPSWVSYAQEYGLVWQPYGVHVNGTPASCHGTWQECCLFNVVIL